MSLVRTSLWNAAAVSIKLLSSLLINKILAVFVGPGGYALIGQFQNTVSIVVTFATGAVNTGVTKHTAEHFDDMERRYRIWKTAGTLVIGTSCLAAVSIIIFSGQLALLVLKNAEYRSVFIWLAISLVFISLNAFLLAVLNGMKEVRRYVISNISGSLIGLVLIGGLSWWFGLIGALIALSVNQAAIFFVTAFQIQRTHWFHQKNMFGAVDPVELQRLGRFALMAVTTAIVVPTSLILVRNHLISNYGLIYAGYWDATWRISTMYLLLATTTLSLYYLPRIAEIRNWPELAKELKYVHIMVLPVVIVISFIIYLSRDFIIPLLFDDSFLPMNQLFAWQLFGDFLKVGAWLIAFLMIGKGLTKTYIVTEICASGLFYILVLVFTSIYGFKGVAMAYACNYGIYWIMVFVLTVATNRKRDALFK